MEGKIHATLLLVHAIFFMQRNFLKKVVLLSINSFERQLLGNQCLKK
jgi:hypothetical protein